MYASILEKCKGEGGKTVYQCQELKKILAAKTYYESHSKEYCSNIIDSIKARISWSNIQQLKDISYTGLAKDC